MGSRALPLSCGRSPEVRHPSTTKTTFGVILSDMEREWRMEVYLHDDQDRVVKTLTFHLVSDATRWKDLAVQAGRMFREELETYRRFPKADTSWAMASYQRLTLPVSDMDAVIDPNTRNFVAKAFLARKDKRKARRGEEKEAYNRLQNFPIKTYREWVMAKNIVRDKNKSKAIARKKKKTVNGFQ